MTKRKTKRNSGRSQIWRDFRIRKDPTAHLADGLSCDVDRVGATRLHEQPFLCAIARDPRTIFASWTIDWRSVFEHTMPADRQVHLRVIPTDGIVEKTVPIEPMSAMHYVTISGLHNAYRVEIGYFQPFDNWLSVATSSEVEMPSQESVEVADVHLATIPFHISFQQLTSLFGAANGTPIAKTISEFQTRVSNGGKPNEPTRFDTKILTSLNLSLDKMAATKRDFARIDTGRLSRRARATFQAPATSPMRGF
ncbi:MAG TPA: DUF4912 domain-containing protein [Chthoniobacterales bacterium]|nr:DUF4912 domain-containing protein [Chthoniobacterales bacterium]